MEEKKDKDSKEEISQDWFEDHESYDEEEDAEEFAEEETNEILEEDEEFNQRVGHFLANQKKDVSLEKILEFPKNSLEENLPKPKEKKEDIENKIDYLTGNMKFLNQIQSFRGQTCPVQKGFWKGKRCLNFQKILWKKIYLNQKKRKRI